jgi:acetyl-CoA carboxylase carboxyltransferase component
MGLPKSAIMGSCVAGGAYLPIMSDEAIIVEARVVYSLPVVTW